MQKPLLETKQEQVGPVTVVVLAGPVDSATYDIFRQAVQTAGKPGALVLLDCTQLTYMNSKSLGLLASYHRQMLSSRGQLALSGLNRKIVKTLDLLGLGQTLKMYDTREAALAEMK